MVVSGLGSLAGVRVLKGHGTGNDFVIVPDGDVEYDLTPSQVRALCDRHFGLGADGVLRVVPTAAVREVAEQAPHARWFMDYRNGDGSIAEMCGNGARVFARYLVDAGLESGPEFAIATRGGSCVVRVESDGDITIDMGTATAPATKESSVSSSEFTRGTVLLFTLPSASSTLVIRGPRRAVPVVSVGALSWNGSGVFVPNPHCVVFLDDDEALAALDLSRTPGVEPRGMFPDGVNVEFVVRHGAPTDRHVRMRVHERGVGETLSCGTGAVAVMVAAAERDGAPMETAYTIDVPGGKVVVTRRADAHLELRGPATIVATATIGGTV